MTPLLMTIFSMGPSLPFNITTHSQSCILYIHHQSSVPGNPKMMSELVSLFHSDLHPVVLVLVSYFPPHPPSFVHLICPSWSWLHLFLNSYFNFFQIFSSPSTLSYCDPSLMILTVFISYCCSSSWESNTKALVLKWRGHITALDQMTDFWVPGIFMKLHR